MYLCTYKFVILHSLRINCEWVDAPYQIFAGSILTKYFIKSREKCKYDSLLKDGYADGSQ